MRSQINKLVNPSVIGDDISERPQRRESAGDHGNKSLIVSDTNDILWKTKQDRYTGQIQFAVMKCGALTHATFANIAEVKIIKNPLLCM